MSQCLTKFNSKPIKVYLVTPTDENTIDSKQFDTVDPQASQVITLDHQNQTYANKNITSAYVS